MSLYLGPKGKKYQRSIANGNFNEFNKKLESLKNSRLKKLLKGQPGVKYILIFGHTSGHIDDAKYKFIIKADQRECYNRFKLRTINDLCSHSDEIRSLINSKLDPMIIDEILFFKFKIRQQIIWTSAPRKYRNKQWNEYIDDFKKHGYDIKSYDEIRKQILKITKTK